MTQYQATPDYYRDYIEHGWLKDQAAKVHKYIKRWRNAAGKWVYQYKEKAKKPESHPSYANWNTQRDWRAEGLYGNQNHRTEARGALLTRYRDIQRAKLNAKNKKVRKGTGYKGSSSPRTNLTSRGYSGSHGSGESRRLSNLGTRKSTKSMITKSNMTSKVRRKQAIGSNVKYDKPFKMGNVVDAKTGKLGTTHYGSYRTRDFIDRANGRNAQKRNVRYSPTYKTKYTWNELKKKNRKQHRYA